MSKFDEMYERKRTSPEAVIDGLKDNDIIVSGMAAMEPQVFLSNLEKGVENHKNIGVYSCLNMKDYSFYTKKEYEGRIFHNSWFHNAGIRKILKEGTKTVTYVPNNLHEAGTNLISRFSPDYYAGIASPMDEHGFFTLSLSVTYEKDVAQVSKNVILEVNKNAPKTQGDTQIHISQISGFYEVDYEIPELSNPEPTALDKRIATHIAELVEDGSTIQIGIGGIPNAIAKLLVNKKNLGIHTEMFTESMIDLFEEGAITNLKKTLWPGKAICTFALGSRKMYDYVDDNPGIWLLRGNYVNNPYVIAQNDNMVSVNTAIMVDLTGQVCSEAIGTRHFSGTGGQLDTHRGAIMSKNGKGIIALSSTTKKNKSKVVPILPAGSPVTIPRQDIDYVVTEYGVAHLRGLSVFQRVKALIEIAHPDFREELYREASKIDLI